MKESPFGFSYSWADMKPIRHLTVAVHCCQAIGALCGYLFGTNHDAFMRIWSGAALASFPGFLLGFVLQRIVRPSGISENRTMVWRLGAIALILTLAAILMVGR